jgi:hypothetical protein
MDTVEILLVYAIGTLFGMAVGAKWGFQKGILYGISETIEQLDHLELLNESPQEIIKKISKIQQNQQNQ